VHNSGGQRRRTPRRGSLEGVLAGVDAVGVFAGHKEYRGLEPARVSAPGGGGPGCVDRCGVFLPRDRPWRQK